MWDSYCGLNYEYWERLNRGEEVELKEVPKLAKKYLIKSEKKKKEDE